MADRELSGAANVNRPRPFEVHGLGGIRRPLGFKRRRAAFTRSWADESSRGAIALGALGTQTVNFVRGKSPLAVIDTPLSA